MSLALMHKQKMLSKKQGQKPVDTAKVVVATTTKGNLFQKLKENLSNELVTLKHANGAEERDPYKKELIEKYRDYAQELTNFESWKDLSVLFWWLMWRLDIDGFIEVQPLLLDGVKRGLTTPVDFNREFLTIYLDEVLVYSKAAFKKGEDFDTQILAQAIEQLNSGDWTTNQPLKAKLYAQHGKILHKNGEFESAAQNYKTALNIDDGVGVKTQMKRAEKEEVFNG